MGSVEDRGNGSYRLSVVIGYDNKGKAIRERMTVKAKGIKDARLKLAEFEMTIRGGTYVKPEKMTLSQFYDDWLHKYAEKELGHDTRTNYVNILNTRILPVYGHMKLSDIKTIHIVNFLDDLSKNGKRLDGKKGVLSASSLNNIYKAFNNILNLAAKWKLINENPASDAKPPKVRSKKTEVYNEEDVGVLLDHMTNEPFNWQTCIMFALTSAARQGEIAALESKHLNFEKNTVRIEQSAYELKGGGVGIKATKTDRERTISVPSAMMDMLKRLDNQRKRETMKAGPLREWPDHLFLFANEFGRPIRPDSIAQYWLRLVEKYNLKKIRFHDLRHTSATLLINKQVHAKIIQERLGHSTISTTMNTYGHVLEEADQKAASHFDSMFEKKHENGGA